MFLGFTFGAGSISKEVVWFSPFMVSPRINIVFIVSCLIDVLVVLSVKDPYNARLNVEKLTWYQS